MATRKFVLLGCTNNVLREGPYAAFFADWVTEEAAPGLPYMCSWGDDPEEIIATPPGEARYRMKADEMTGIMLSNPKDRRIKELEAEVVRLKAVTD